MVIQHNIAAINSHRNLGINNSQTNKNLEKLSSGFRINRAGDDAAGLAISEKMRGQIRGLAMAEQNTSNGISLIQTAEGGLNETHAILQRMRELAVQSSNGTYQQEDRDQIQLEFDALRSEIDRIASSTHYNGINLLDGTVGNGPGSGTGNVSAGDIAVTNTTNAALEDAVITYTFDLIQKDGVIYGNAGGEQFEIIGAAATWTSDNGTVFDFSDIITNFGQDFVVYNLQVTVEYDNSGDVDTFDINEDFRESIGDNQLVFQIGANGTADQQVGMYVANMSTASLGTAGVGGAKLADTNTHVRTREAANAAIKIIDDATNQVSSQRAELGALQNRLEHTLNNLGVTKENLTAAESTIRDVDMAKEMMEFTKNSILVQASQAMLAQANSLPQGVLSLLR